MPDPLAPTRRRRGRHRRRPAPLPLVRAAFGALVLAVVVGGVPAAGPAGIVPGSVPVVAQPPTRTPAEPAGPPDRSAEVAGVAVQAALAQLGLPYEWGGDGPAAGDTGFDCSGLTRHAYAAAGVALPRTAHTQFYAGPGVPDGAPLQPGDLVFYGTLARVHHVGLYLGDGAMVNAPSRGRPVQVARHRFPGDAYLGATRPAALGDPTLVPPRPAPPPAPVPLPEVFPAPPAPLPDGLRDDVRAAAPPQPDALAAGTSGVGDIVAARRSLRDGPPSRPGAHPPGHLVAPAPDRPTAGPVDGTGTPPAPVVPGLPAAPSPAASLVPAPSPAPSPSPSPPPAASLVPVPSVAPAPRVAPARPGPPVQPGPAAQPGPGYPPVPGDPAVPGVPAAPAGPPVAAAPARPADRDAPAGTLVATRDRHVVVPAGAPGPGGPAGRVLHVPPDLLDGLVPGDPVEVTTGDVTDDLTVVSRTEVPVPEPAAGTATALAAPGPDGLWTLVVLG